MNRQGDPPRLVEQADPFFRELEQGIRQARAQGPTAAQREQLQRALGLSGGATFPKAVVRQPQLNALLLGGLTLLSAGWLTWGLLPRATDDSSSVELDTAEFEASGRRADESRLVDGSRPSSASRQEAGSALAPDSTPHVSEEVPAAKPADAMRRGGHRPAEPHASSSVRPPRRAAKTVGADDTVASASGASTVRELSLLQRARAHAHSAPQQALALVSEHETKFPKGILVQEREVIAIEALLIYGDRDAAEARAREFFERFPGSAHGRRVRVLLQN